MPRKNIEVQTNCSKKFCDDNAVDRSYRPIQANIQKFSIKDPSPMQSNMNRDTK